jgi:osmoprotectant transport system ATP-binding protein
VAEFVGADRGLKRLSVTGIDLADLERPPLVGLDDTVAEARAALEGSGSRWAVVIDGQGQLRGWIGRDDLAGAGTSSVGARVHRMEAFVPLGASLKDAFSEMLQRDAGWVAVLDGDNYLGVLTPDSLHAALRRSVDRADGVEPAESPVWGVGVRSGEGRG